MRFLPCFLAALLLPVAGSAAPYLLKDINSDTASSSTEFGQKATLGGKAFFTAADPEQNVQLWVTDGTPAGTLRLATIGYSSSSLDSPLIVSQGRVWYPGLDPAGTGLVQLCVSDGTLAGTQAVSTVERGISAKALVAAPDGTFYFCGKETATGTELWCSDGTPAGTRLVKDLVPGTGSFTMIPQLCLGSRVLLVGTDRIGISDGTEAGTQEVYRWTDSSWFDEDTPLVATSQHVFFTHVSNAQGGELWRTDGTAAGTLLVKDIVPGSGSAFPTNFFVHDDTLFFAAAAATTNYELWKSDGTEAGTVLVKDQAPGTASAKPVVYHPLNGRLIYAGEDGTNPGALYVTDGTAEGTQRLASTNPSGVPAKYPAGYRPVLFKGRLFFGSNELMSTDGTPEGTRVDVSLNLGFASRPRPMAVVGDRLFFTALRNISGPRALWITDGTQEGTVKVSDQAPDEVGFGDHWVTAVPGHLVYRTTTTENGTELWTSDGTSTGTQLLQEISNLSGDSNPQALGTDGSTLYFSASILGSRSLWKTDGTEAGTVQLAEGFTCLYPGVKMGGHFYFGAYGSAVGSGVWRTDGTVAGTQKILAEVSTFAATNDRIYYIKDLEIWSSTGTPGSEVKFIAKGAYAGKSIMSIEGLASVGDRLFFTTYHIAQGAKKGLWTVNPGTSTPVFLSEISSSYTDQGFLHLQSAGGKLHFILYPLSAGTAAWGESDGTVEGTRLLATLQDYHTFSLTEPPQVVSNQDYRFLFLNDFNGTVYASDGTPSGAAKIVPLSSTFYSAHPTLFKGQVNWLSGTTILRSNGLTPITRGWLKIPPNFPPGIYPNTQCLFASAERLYFFLTHPSRPNELWASDGTNEGSFLHASMPRSTDSINFLGATPGHFFFSRSGGGFGNEIYVLKEVPEMELTEAGAAVMSAQPLNFGEAFLDQPPATRTFTLRNAGLKPLTVSGLSMSGSASADFTLVNAPELPLTLQPGSAAVTLTVAFTPHGTGLRQGTWNLQSNDDRQPDLQISLTGQGVQIPAVITQSPSSQLLLLGNPGQLGVVASGLELGHAWIKGDSQVATGPALVIPSVTAADAGIYTVRIQDRYGIQVTSDPAYAGVMTALPDKVQVKAGGAITLTAAAQVPPGTMLSWQWLQNGLPLAGQTQSTLKLTKLQGTQAGRYTCLLQMRLSPGGALLAEATPGETLVQVTTAPPVLSQPEFPLTYIGDAVEFAVPAPDDVTRFSASGLPTGLSIDPLTGIIHGTPVRAGVFKVKITAANSSGSRTTPAVAWTIRGLDELADLGSSFEALIAPGSGNGGLGGWLSLTLTPNGAATGSVILGGKKQAFKGQLSFDRQSDATLLPARLTLSIPRGKQSPLALDLTIGQALNETHLTLQGTLDGSTVTGWNTGALLTKAGPQPVNTALQFSGGSSTGEDDADERPRGHSYAVPRRSGSTALRWAGTLADGTAFTASHLLSHCSEDTHQTLMHTSLHQATGSVQGSFTLTAATTTGATFQGEAGWIKLAQPSTSKTRSYKDGFGPLTLTARGQTYLRPASTDVVLGLPATPDNIFVTIDHLNPPPVLAGISFTLNAKGQFKLEPATGNPLLVVPKLNLATGLITGSFTLKNVHPIAGAKPAELVRKTAFSALLVPHPEVQAGIGFFNLAGLPASTFEKLTTTPLQSGSFHLAAPSQMKNP